MEVAHDKLSLLASSKLHELEFLTITPDKNNNWVNLANNDFDDHIRLASKESKSLINDTHQTVLKFFSLGVSTNRDEWVIDTDLKRLDAKTTFFINFYNKFLGSIPKNLKK